MQLSDFDYALPEHLIARHPLPERSASRLLYLPKNQSPQDKSFSDLPHLLNAGDLLVFNDTKVMKARLFGKKSSGGAVEVLVERILETPKFAALCHVKASRSPKKGQLLYLAHDNICVQVLDRVDNLFILQFEQPILPLLEQYGALPIPPYFDRQANPYDDTRYQTVFHNPNKMASVAAPTASLHFDQTILNTLENQGIQTAFVTLHVGAGTFAPVKTDNILAHKMHSEYAHLPQTTVEQIHTAKKNGKHIIAVGTTVTRVLETAFQKAKETHQPLSAWQGDTNIFIYPPYQFGVVDRLMTNFHLPKSTLLMLVSAFAGIDNIQQAYQHAIHQQYRFFSYGDAMLLDKI